MLDFTNCNIENVIVHQVGNKTNDEDLNLSKSLPDVDDLKLRELLMKFFSHSFTENEFYNFSFSNDDFNLNPLFKFCSDIFLDPTTFKPASDSIAQYLYEVSVHPKIKSGDLFIALFSNILIDDELLEGIGIFKSENKQSFLKINKFSKDVTLNYDQGIDVERLDKGCLILNVDKNKGYKICVVDKLNRTGDTQYWKDRFLNLKPSRDEYQFTKEVLTITKKYLTNQLSEDFKVSQMDKIDLMNRSIEYFKTKEIFEEKEFESDVFIDENLIESFRIFNTQFKDENNIDIKDSFEISAKAVKKQSKIYKNILKLDENFHIYIHGGKELIEQGTDSDGRKFYKIYYKDEK